MAFLKVEDVFMSLIVAFIIGLDRKGLSYGQYASAERPVVALFQPPFNFFRFGRNPYFRPHFFQHNFEPQTSSEWKGFYTMVDNNGNNRGVYYTSDGKNGVNTVVIENGQVVQPGRSAKYGEFNVRGDIRDGQQLKGVYKVFDDRGNNRVVYFVSDGQNVVTENGQAVQRGNPIQSLLSNGGGRLTGFYTVYDSNGNTRTVEYTNDHPNGFVVTENGQAVQPAAPVQGSAPHQNMATSPSLAPVASYPYIQASPYQDRSAVHYG